MFVRPRYFVYHCGEPYPQPRSGFATESYAHDFMDQHSMLTRDRYTVVCAPVQLPMLDPPDRNGVIPDAGCDTYAHLEE